MSDGKISKQKRTRLSYKQKLEIINLIRNGADRQSVAKEYNIGVETVRKMVSEKEKIEEAGTQYELMNKKSGKKSDFPLIEGAMSTWFYQARECGEVVNGPILCQKALEFWDHFNKNGAISNTGQQKFTASSGWLGRFKKRHGIRRSNPNGETLSSDNTNVEEFCADLKNKMEVEGIRLENLYNTDESGINYRSLARTTLASHLESSAGESEEKKDRYTALFCSNASGTHKLQLFCIGNATNPRDIKNKKMPVFYKGRRGAWMSRDFFLEWYQFHFIPEVKERQKNTGNEGKVLLLMDNAPSHPGKNVLDAIDPNFEVIYLPPNKTAQIQPCDQGLISTTKKKYRRKLLEKLHKERDYSLNIIENMNKITLYASFVLLSGAWDEIESSILRKIWKPLLGTMIEEIDEFNHLDSSTFDVSTDEKADLQLIESIIEDFMPEEKGNTELKHEIREWLNKDDGDAGWHQQSCNEIVEVLIQENQQNFQSLGYENMFHESEDPLEFLNGEELMTTEGNPQSKEISAAVTLNSMEVMTIEGNSRRKEISATEALNSINIIEQWFRQQNDLPALDIVQNYLRNRASFLSTYKINT